MYLVLKLYKNKNLRCSFRGTAHAADMCKLNSICSMTELSERNFCDDLEIKFTSTLAGIQQAWSIRNSCE